MWNTGMASCHVCAHTGLIDHDREKFEEAVEFTCTVLKPDLETPWSQVALATNNSVNCSTAPLSSWQPRRARRASNRQSATTVQV
jgi:hypothetical protein